MKTLPAILLCVFASLRLCVDARAQVTVAWTHTNLAGLPILWDTSLPALMADITKGTTNCIWPGTNGQWTFDFGTNKTVYWTIVAAYSTNTNPPVILSITNISPKPAPAVPIAPAGPIRPITTNAAAPPPPPLPATTTNAAPAKTLNPEP